MEFLKAARYRNLDLGRLNYLAVAVDCGDEARRNLDKINQILQWLSSFGVKNVILYDREGVLAKCIDSDTPRFRGSSAVSPQLAVKKDKPFHHEKMAIEFLSSSNGKEGVAKAASFLCSRHLSGGDSSAQPVFTEADMTSALMAVGSGGPDPDLLLVYGPVRCHLGFPSWRLRYTEIIHMGELKSSRHGALVKALYKFSKKHQNYGKGFQLCFKDHKHILDFLSSLVLDTFERRRGRRSRSSSSSRARLRTGCDSGYDPTIFIQKQD